MLETIRSWFRFGPKSQSYCDLAEYEGKPVFKGTTAELLSSVQQLKEEVPVEAPVEQEACSMSRYKEDSVWLNIEFLKMALEIEASKNQKMVFYVDVGNLPKKKAEEYVQDLMTQHKEKVGNKESDYWLPRREGGRGTELNSLPGRVTLDAVLETAQKLKDFATK
jgi:Bacteriophage T4-like portal protein (Gp20)